MNSTIQNIVSELDQLAIALAHAIPNDEPLNIAHDNWTSPGLSKSELIDATNRLALEIKDRAPDSLGEKSDLLQDYIRRLAYLRNSVIPHIWGNAAAGIPAYMETLNGLCRAITPLLRTDEELATQLSSAGHRITRRLRALESRLNEAEPRSTKLAEMVERIEQAFDAADQLPSDLQALEEAREKLNAILESAQENSANISINEKAAQAHADQLASKATEADSVLAHCHSAYAAATSQGLAAAFAERSQSLARSMWVWTGAFVAALVAGAYFGTVRVHEIGELLRNPAMTNWALAINLVLAALSVGAPIWFGWLATKQINQRFRLAEDYAFKASVSRAYEGYRREAARIDKDMEARLLDSALTRLDEQPLRFVEPDNYGTPWHELASSASVKAALKHVPGFAKEVRDFAESALKSASPFNRDAGQSPEKTTPSSNTAAHTVSQNTRENV